MPIPQYLSVVLILAWPGSGSRTPSCPRKVQLMAVAVPGDRQGLNLLVLEHCSSDATLLSGTSLSMVLPSLADDPLDHSIRSQLGTQTDVTLGGC
jgi:hypothetical protein